jgi:hypothetical protein
VATGRNTNAKQDPHFCAGRGSGGGPLWLLPLLLATASLHTAIPTGMTDSGARDGLTNSGSGIFTNNSTRRSHLDGEQVGDFEGSDHLATN